MGGVTVTVPSLFATTFGASGGVISFVALLITAFLAAIVAAGLPSVKFTITVPSSPTLIVVPSAKFG